MIKLIKGLLKIAAIVMTAYAAYRFTSRLRSGQLHMNLEYDVNPSQKLPRLNARQKEIYELFLSRGELDMADIDLEINGVTRRTLRRDLNKLIEENLIEKEGKTKSSRYTLVAK